ncbi:2-dehydropantoate 2-reductase [Neobacillus dielmonensis]|uniref:2-dehydropantoate 2-reductase n=1 Tax=Neobacillus dielmonensis TaxID=1347369 RepID=UPI0005AB6D8B|nr:2-dehydropantoate 2-reductase [Neobacillus dielmonensis]
MKVGIIGAGSIGLLFASYLSKDFEVTLYTRTQEQAAEINQNGLWVKKGCNQTCFPPQAKTFDDWEGTEQLTIITVKQYQLQPIIEKVRMFTGPLSNLLFLQNGMGHLEQLESIQGYNLFVGTVEHGAVRESMNTVCHNGEGVTNVAVFKGKPDLLLEFTSAVSENFPVIFQENYKELLVNKLIVNAVINPLTAVLQVTNGKLITNPYYLKTAQELTSEVCFILNIVNGDEQLKRVLSICQNTANNQSSMLKDLEAGRKTEVEAILGYLQKEAVSKKKPAPILEALYWMIQGKELDGRGRV